MIEHEISRVEHAQKIYTPLKMHSTQKRTFIVGICRDAHHRIWFSLRCFIFFSSLHFSAAASVIWCYIIFMHMQTASAAFPSIYTDLHSDINICMCLSKHKHQYNTQIHTPRGKNTNCKLATHSLEYNIYRYLWEIQKRPCLESNAFFLFKYSFIFSRSSDMHFVSI